MTGASGLSKHESTVSCSTVCGAELKLFLFPLFPPQMLSDACKKELRRFDSERVLVAWDGLITQQQEHLARLGVPTMFVTDVVADREVKRFI
jgi:hypothetical protein